MDLLFSELSGHLAYLIIFLLLFLCGLGIPLPEELTLLMAGYLSYEGSVKLEFMWVICVLGITLGDSMLFLIGKKWGTKVAAHPRIVKLLHLERQEKIKNHFKKHGAKTIFFVRFMSGLRGAAHMLAGSMGFPFWKYLLTNFFAILIHVTLVAGLGYVFGNHIAVVRHHMDVVKHVLILAIVVVIIGLILKYSYFAKKIPGS
ncbi:MAG: DedA family protein [Deltaproteobacteria bacterium]|nr:DedA family protein [Deltaproteobacteria bacterium]